MSQVKKERLVQTRIAHASAYSKAEMGVLRVLAKEPSTWFSASEVSLGHWGVVRNPAPYAAAVLHRLVHLGMAIVSKENTRWRVSPTGLEVAATETKTSQA